MIGGIGRTINFAGAFATAGAAGQFAATPAWQLFLRPADRGDAHRPSGRQHRRQVTYPRRSIPLVEHLGSHSTSLRHGELCQQASVSITVPVYRDRSAAGVAFELSFPSCSITRWFPRRMA